MHVYICIYYYQSVDKDLGSVSLPRFFIRHCSPLFPRPQRPTSQECMRLIVWPAMVKWIKWLARKINQKSEFLICRSLWWSTATRYPSIRCYAWFIETLCGSLTLGFRVVVDNSFLPCTRWPLVAVKHTASMVHVIEKPVVSGLTDLWVSSNSMELENITSGGKWPEHLKVASRAMYRVPLICFEYLVGFWKFVCRLPAGCFR